MSTEEDLVEFHAHVQHSCDLVLCRTTDKFLKTIVNSTTEMASSIQSNHGTNIDDLIENALERKKLETTLEIVDIYINIKYGVNRYAK